MFLDYPSLNKKAQQRLDDSVSTFGFRLRGLRLMQSSDAFIFSYQKFIPLKATNYPKGLGVAINIMMAGYYNTPYIRDLYQYQAVNGSPLKERKGVKKETDLNYGGKSEDALVHAVLRFLRKYFDKKGKISSKDLQSLAKMGISKGEILGYLGCAFTVQAKIFLAKSFDLETDPELPFVYLDKKGSKA